MGESAPNVKKYAQRLGSTTTASGANRGGRDFKKESSRINRGETEREREFSYKRCRDGQRKQSFSWNQVSVNHHHRLLSGVHVSQLPSPFCSLTRPLLQQLTFGGWKSKPVQSSTQFQSLKLRSCLENTAARWLSTFTTICPPSPIHEASNANGKLAA